MDSKKISFGFSKSIKKSNFFATAKDETKNDVQLIDCLEGHSIKVIGAKEEIKAPLIIPLKDDAKNLLDRVREVRRREKEAQNDVRPDSELTLDELAARQLLQEAKIQTTANGTKVHTVPISADKLPLNGEKEPTLEDYENVPISDFGFAMLRGMGWKDGMNIGKNQQENLKVKEPELRPKGLGLGATKMVKQTKPKVAVDKEGKELQLIKGACAKVIAGTHKGKYGEVQGLDEESGRIIIKTTISCEVLSLNEFLVVPVTKEEYEKCSKILNLEMYKEYKSKTDNKSTSKTEHETDRGRRRGTPSRKARSPSSDSSDDRTRKKIPDRGKKKKSKKNRSRSRSPIRSKSGRSRRRSRERSGDERPERSESSESERSKHKKKSKKSKKSHRDDSDNDRYRRKSKKNKTRRRADDDSFSEDDKYRKK